MSDTKSCILPVYFMYKKKKNIYPGFLMVVLGGTEIPLLVLQYLDYRR